MHIYGLGYTPVWVSLGDKFKAENTLWDEISNKLHIHMKARSHIFSEICKSDFWVPRKTSVVRQRHTHVWREYIRVTSMQNFTLEIRSKRTLALLVILQGNIPLRRQLASYFGGMAEHIPICRESARLGKIMSTLNDGVHVSALTKTLI